MNPQELLQLVTHRREYYQDRNQRMSTLVSIYNGELHKVYPKEFPADDIPIAPNLIKLAWDQFAAMVSKVPDKTIRPVGVSDAANERASKIEQIVHSYDEGDRIKVLTHMAAWYLIGCGQCVWLVLPDFVCNKPRFHVEDPRNTYPSPGFEQTYAAPTDKASAVTNGLPASQANRDMRSARHGSSGEPFFGGDLEDLAIERLATIRSLKSRFPRAAQNLGPDTDPNLRRNVRVVEYFTRTDWQMIAVDGNTPTQLMNVRHDLGFVPGRVTQSFSPDQVGGISQFEEQVPLLIALARVWNQKLAFNDNSAWPQRWVKGSINTMRIGPFEYLQLEPNTEVGQFAPPAEFQSDRDIQSITSLIRTLNREGPATTGDVSGGPITGRGLEQAFRPTDTVVQNYFNLQSSDLAAVYGYALAIDEQFWPDDRKEFAGRRNGEEFEGSYIPSKDIKGHRSVRVTYGFGVGGVEGFLQGLQAMQAGLMSEETLMQMMPGVLSVAAEQRKITLNQIRKAILAAFDQGDVPRAQYLGQVYAELQSGVTLTDALAKIPPPPAPGEQALPGAGAQAPLNGLPPGANQAEQQAVALAGGGAPAPMQMLLNRIR